jgi:uncharacterized protein (DUF58 family)
MIAPAETPPERHAAVPAHRRVGKPFKRDPRVARVRPGLDFSVTGLVYCTMMMFLGLAAINSQAPLLFGVFGLMVGVLLASGVISRWVLRGVLIERKPPGSSQAGQVTQIRYRVDNRKTFWPTFSLTVAELDVGGRGGAFDRQPHAYLLHVASGMTAEIAADVVPLRRGWVQLERFQLSTSFPFGFIKRAVVRTREDRLLVGPPRAALDTASLDRFLSADSTGLNQQPRAGGNDELFGIREYRQGDSPRTIHWRRSARTAMIPRGQTATPNLVVKQMHRVSPPRLVIVPDTRARSDDAEELGRVEKNLAVAATLIAGAADRNLMVGLVIAGTQKREFRPERGKQHRRDLLQAIAEAVVDVDPNAAVSDLPAAASRFVVGDTTGVIVTHDGQATSLDLSARTTSNFQTIDVENPSLQQLMRFADGIDWSSLAHPMSPEVAPSGSWMPSFLSRSRKAADVPAA